VVDRGYTDRNQLDDVDYTPPAGAAAAVIDSLFDAGMRETQRTHGNGLITTRTYDRDDNLVTDIRVETSLSANDRTGLSFNYSASGYDANKNVLKETTGAPMAGYSWTTAGGATSAYDDEDRLTYWERTSGATTSLEWPQTSGQGLTLVGDWDTVKINGAAQARTHGAAHELTAVGASSLSLDVKGNITQDTTKTNTHNYTWDFDNRMSFADVDGAGGDEIEYTYDALGRRVSKKFPVGMTTSTIVFTCMGGQVNSEYAANTRGTTPLCKYVYGQYIDEPLILIKVEVSKEEEEKFVAVDSLTITETKYYYHANRQYSVTGLTDSAKTVVERYAHTAYGETTILAPNGTTVRTTSSYGNPYLYTGRRLDHETGLYYYRARYYDSALGRFISRDSLGYVDGLSLYRGYFVPNSLDPFGNDDPEWAKGTPRKGGKWLGQRGNSAWNPSGNLPIIPYVEGQPDFSEWIHVEEQVAAPGRCNRLDAIVEIDYDSDIDASESTRRTRDAAAADAAFERKLREAGMLEPGESWQRKPNHVWHHQAVDGNGRGQMVLVRESVHNAAPHHGAFSAWTNTLKARASGSRAAANAAKSARERFKRMGRVAKTVGGRAIVLVGVYCTCNAVIDGYNTGGASGAGVEFTRELVMADSVEYVYGYAAHTASTSILPPGAKAREDRFSGKNPKNGNIFDELGIPRKSYVE
jgi:RHS repeat-associated protein